MIAKTLPLQALPHAESRYNNCFYSDGPSQYFIMQSSTDTRTHTPTHMYCLCLCLDIISKKSKWKRIYVRISNNKHNTYIYTYIFTESKLIRELKIAVCEIRYKIKLINVIMWMELWIHGQMFKEIVCYLKKKIPFFLSISVPLIMTISISFQQHVYFKFNWNFDYYFFSLLCNYFTFWNHRMSCFEIKLRMKISAGANTVGWKFT